MGQRILWMVSATAMVLTSCATPGSGYFRPDLSDDIIARVVPGQGSEEISLLLGKPYQRVKFENLKSTAWDYMYKDTWGYWVSFSVMVGDDGRVVNKVSRRFDMPDRD